MHYHENYHHDSPSLLELLVLHQIHAFLAHPTNKQSSSSLKLTFQITLLAPFHNYSSDGEYEGHFEHKSDESLTVSPLAPEAPFSPGAPIAP